MPKAQMPAELADRDGNRISDSLQVRLEKAAPSARFDVIVTFTRAGSVAAAQARVGRFDVKRQFRLIRGVSASLSASQIRALSRMPGVFRIEENAKVQVAMSAARADFGADLAVSTYGVDGTGVGICVIDTGADGNHEQLDGGKIASWKDFVSNQATPYDDHSHGTHVASIAAGAGTGGSLADDFRGVAPGAPLHIAKALDAAGNGDEDVIIAAIQWCAEKVDVHVISMSLGTITASDGGDAMSQAVNNAVTTKGKVVVVAAGNSGDAPSTVGSPGAAVYATTVGAIAEHSAPPGAVWHSDGIFLDYFSSRGPTLSGVTKPDVVAPGDSIAAAASGTTNAYAVMSGTSMATPFVAGAMALALDANPGLTPASAKSLLESTAEDWGPSGKDNDWGSGLIDVAKLVGEAQDGRAEATTSFPTHTRVTGSVPDNGVWSHQFSVDASGLGTPVAVTVILNGQLECVWWFGPWCLAEEWTPDQDARLLDPNGQPVLDPNGLPLESTCAADEECGVGRQETLHFVPTLAGTYTVEVYPWPEGPGTGGSFAVDISQGPLGSAPPPSPPPPPDPQLPDAPVLSATPGDGTVHLSWTVPDDGGSALTVYTIYRGTSSGSLSELASVGAGTTTHDDIAVTNGTTYYYGVSAENANGEGPRSNEVSAKPADPNPPGQPTGLVATPASGRVALDWNDNPETDLAGYNVYRATSLAGPWTKANGSLVAGSAYTDTGLTNGTTYHFRVAAVDTSGNEGPTSSDVSATPNLKGYSPGTVTITRGAAVGDPVSNLNNSDDAYYRVGSRKSGGKHWTDWYGEFTVDVAVTKLYVEFEGKYSRTVSQTVYVYNYDTGAWLKIETKSVGTTDVRSTYAVGGDPDPYISSAGKVRLRVASSAGGSFTSSGDRLRIAVEY